MLIVNDATVKGGTMFGMTTKRHTRAQLFAWQHRLPCITMVQSSGGFLPDPANIFPDDGQASSIMYNQVKMSSEGIAQIALVHGPATAGGAHIPALCDEVVIIRTEGEASEEATGALNWARQPWCAMVIGPVETRAVIAQLLDIAGRTPSRPTQFAVFRM